MLQIPNDRGVFTLDIAVKQSDIDEQNHVNNVMYVQWIQDVAYAHWRTLGSEELLGKYNWVVLRHEIDYHSPALAGDTVIASTWIDVPEGPRQRRYVSIRRSGDDRVLTSATTTWCLLDALSGRPKRVTEEITAVFGLKN
ncbi:thioesterase family protein [soil metagenome]